MFGEHCKLCIHQAFVSLRAHHYVHGDSNPRGHSYRGSMCGAGNQYGHSFHLVWTYWCKRLDKRCGHMRALEENAWRLCWSVAQCQHDFFWARVRVCGAASVCRRRSECVYPYRLSGTHRRHFPGGTCHTSDPGGSQTFATSLRGFQKQTYKSKNLSESLHGPA